MLYTRPLRYQASRPFYAAGLMAKIKAVPLELWPLARAQWPILRSPNGKQMLKDIPTDHSTSVAVGFAVFSTTKKLASDRTLRLSRNKPEERVNH
ncbi:hypothetical protein KEM56_003361 [Ascosphaera pollenicola]|nr:hypothetical protein KEM56_003361 [Ascosphaera pollenicola]